MALQVKGQEKYPKKLIEKHNYKVLCVVTRFNLPDVIHVIKLIHDNMQRAEDEPTNEMDDSINEIFGLPAFNLPMDVYKQQMQAGPGEFPDTAGYFEEDNPCEQQSGV